MSGNENESNNGEQGVDEDQTSERSNTPSGSSSGDEEQQDVVLSTEPNSANSAAAAPPAPVGPINEYTIHDFTTEQIQSRIVDLNARNVAGATTPLTSDEQLELAQLELWEATKKQAELGSAPQPDINAAATLVKDKDAKLGMITGANASKNPWVYAKNYATAKTTKIDDIKTILGNKLASLKKDDDKKAIIDDVVNKLTNQDHTLESMEKLRSEIDTTVIDRDPTKAKAQLQTLMQPLAIRTPPPVPAGKAPTGKVATNKTQKLEIPKVNPFVLESKEVIAQMVEAFFKSFMTWPWQVVSEIGLRMVSEVLSKPAGMAMTVLGAVGKFLAIAGNVVGFDMRTTHSNSDYLLKKGADLDGTLPLFYSPVVGLAQLLIGSISNNKALKDAGKQNLSGYTAEKNFKNSIFLTPLRIIPVGGALVWNTLNMARTTILAVGNFGMLGINSGIGRLFFGMGFDSASKNRFTAAKQYTNNFRYYRDATLGNAVYMLTHPFSGILAPAPISEGGKITKQGAYGALEQVSPWWGVGNMGRWLSDTYSRGNVANNPRIKEEGYFTKQPDKVKELSDVLQAMKVPQAALDKLIERISNNNYPIAEMDAYIAAMKDGFKSNPNMTTVQLKSLHDIASDNLNTPQVVNLPVPRGFIETSGAFVLAPITFVATAPFAVAFGIGYALWKAPEIFKALWNGLPSLRAGADQVEPAEIRATVTEAPVAVNTDNNTEPAAPAVAPVLGKTALGNMDNVLEELKKTIAAKAEAEAAKAAPTAPLPGMNQTPPAPPLPQSPPPGIVLTNGGPVPATNNPVPATNIDTQQHNNRRSGWSLPLRNNEVMVGKPFAVRFSAVVADLNRRGYFATTAAGPQPSQIGITAEPITPQPKSSTSGVG